MSISKKVQHMLNEESFSGSEPKDNAHYGDMKHSAIEKITKFGRAAKEHAKSASQGIHEKMVAYPKTSAAIAAAGGAAGALGAGYGAYKYIKNRKDKKK